MAKSNLQYDPESGRYYKIKDKPEKQIKEPKTKVIIKKVKDQNKGKQNSVLNNLRRFITNTREARRRTSNRANKRIMLNQRELLRRLRIQQEMIRKMQRNPQQMQQRQIQSRNQVRPVVNNQQMQQQIYNDRNSMYYEDTDLFTSQKVIRKRLPAEAWIKS